MNNLNSTCPFCTPEREIIIENKWALAFFDQYPVTDGHCLVIPKRHVEDLDDLTIDEYHSLFELVKSIIDYLKKNQGQDSFNIGANLGRAAGQTINHIHVHVIPRKIGDVDDATGGIRGVIPSKRKY